MAQRKAKESLIAEIPKPRLTDEELMDMFYGGERSNAKRLVQEEALRDAFANVSDLMPITSIGMKGVESEPSPKEPSSNKPSIIEPSYEEPLTQGFYDNSSFSRNPFPQIEEAKIISSDHEPLTISQTK